MGRHLRYLPSAVIVAVVAGIAACAPPPPPIIPHPPQAFPIPAVVAVEICQHRVLPGYRYNAVAPESGLYAWEWQLTNGAWVRTAPWWYNKGETIDIETARPFHVIWTPTNIPNPVWHVVSPDYIPQPFPACPDY